MRKALAFIIPAVIIFAILITLFRLNAHSTASSQFQTQQTLTVGNSTRAFTVINAIRDGDIVRLSFRNDYSQAINAFTLASGRNSGVEVDLLANDHEIAPGAESTPGAWNLPDRP